MGKHPVSTTIDMDVNKELDELCDGKCSKYKFIRDAIVEKMERTKHERGKERIDLERESPGTNQRGNSGSTEDDGDEWFPF